MRRSDDDHKVGCLQALSRLRASRWCARGRTDGACVGRVHLERALQTGATLKQRSGPSGPDPLRGA